MSDLAIVLLCYLIVGTILSLFMLVWLFRLSECPRCRKVQGKPGQGGSGVKPAPPKPGCPSTTCTPNRQLPSGGSGTAPSFPFDGLTKVEAERG